MDFLECWPLVDMNYNVRYQTLHLWATGRGKLLNMVEMISLKIQVYTHVLGKKFSSSSILGIDLQLSLKRMAFKTK